MIRIQTFAAAPIAALLSFASAAQGTQKTPLAVAAVPQNQPGDAIAFNTSAKPSVPISFSHGAPGNPNNGDCWTTISGLYCRLHGVTIGPVPGTANDTTFTATLNGTIANPSYERGGYRAYHVFNLGALDYAEEYATEQAGLAATDAFTAALKVGSGTIHQTNAIAGYIQSSRPRQPTNGGDVAGYFHGKAAGDNVNVFGLNSLVSDTPGYAGQTLQNEIDVNVNAPSTSVQGLGLVLNSTQTIAAPPLGFVCRTVATTRWGACYYTVDGATSLAFRVGATGTGNNLSSQSIQFISRSNGGATYAASIASDASGSLVLQPGVASGSVTFQGAGGFDYGHIDSTGLVTSAVVASSEANAGLTALTMTNASPANVTTKAISQVFKGYDTTSREKTAAQTSVVPLDINWVNAYVSLSVRKSDVVTEVARITGEGIASLGGVKLGVVAAANLPACNAGNEGFMYGVKDASSTTFNTAVAGGGSDHIIAYCNGKRWTVH